ncbi:MAG: hypothetical protein ACTSX6_04740 [Candidatus Heimdallarchaeaceae archaeon]
MTEEKIVVQDTTFENWDDVLLNVKKKIAGKPLETVSKIVIEKNLITVHSAKGFR